MIRFIPFWTDGALLSEYAGIPAVVLGPVGYGGHTREERIFTDIMPKAALAYALAAVSFCHSV